MSDDCDWKAEPPYALDPNSKEDDYNKHTGSCNCGLVTYGFKRREPLDCKYCHCSDCRRLHGAPYQHAAIFYKTDVLFSPSSIKHISFYCTSRKVQERILPCKVYCGNCHSPIMDEGRNMLLIFPPLVHGMDDSSEKGDEVRRCFAAKCHIYYRARVVDVLDGLDKWSRHKGTSDLLPEKRLE